MTIDIERQIQMDISRNDLLEEVLLRSLHKGAWNDGRQLEDEERDYMIQAVGEHHTRYMTDADFGQYVLNRFGFGLYPRIRLRAHVEMSDELSYELRNTLDVVYAFIGEDALDQYVNSTKGDHSGINTTA